MKRLLLSAAAVAAIAIGAPAFAAAPNTPPVIAAIQAKDWTTAMGLVNADTVKATDQEGSTALLWAAHEGNGQLVKALLAAGADAKAANALGSTPIIEALNSGDAATINAILDAGGDVENLSPTGVSSLMFQARLGNAEAVKALIAHGAQVNRKETTDDQTALMWAADQGRGEVVEILVKAGAEVNGKTRFRPVPLRVSTEPRVNHNAYWGMQTPLLYAARSGCVQCAKALIEGGAEVDLYDGDFVTPLINATINARWDVAKYLVEAGADVDHFDWWGRSALYGAVDYNTIPKGGRADVPSPDETTPLALMELLLQKGANPNVQLKYIPPYRQSGADRGGDLLLSGGATPLLRAAKVGDSKAVELLLKYNARTDLRSWRAWRDEVDGITPLMAAAGLGWELDDTRGKDKTEAETIEVIKDLLAAGADINAQDSRGRTPVHGAVFVGYNDILKFLLQNGANPYLPDADGRSAYDIANSTAESFRGQEMRLSPDAPAILAEFAPPRPTQNASR